MTANEPQVRAGISGRSIGAWAGALFLFFFVVYHANGTVLDEGDAVPTANLPVALLETGGFSFDPDRFPEMFKWKTTAPIVERDDFYFLSFADVLGDRTVGEWRRSGHVRFGGPRYYLARSERTGEYVSVFGPIPGLALLPVMAPLYALDHDVYLKPVLRAFAAKVVGSVLVAACAALLFVIAARRTTRARAVLVACVYALGTCARSVSSQSLWQQTVNQFWLVLGAVFLTGELERAPIAALAGFFFGTAAASRPTGLVVLVFATAYVHFAARRRVAAFVGAALPPLVAVGIYNFHYFGSPFRFGQELAGHAIAFAKTGSPDLWQTPFLVGLAGLLVSPSRGLLVFSPVLAPAAWGVVRLFRDPAWRVLRPLAAASLLVMATQCKWFDWWGGHAYGYRPWLDVMPYLSLCLLPVLDDVLGSTVRRAGYAALFAWSMAVQALGAFVYDRTWNARRLYVVRQPDSREPLGYFDEGDALAAADRPGASFVGMTECDIDLPYCRYRLWSLEDNVIRYYLGRMAKSRRGRLVADWYLLSSPRPNPFPY